MKTRKKAHKIVTSGADAGKGHREDFESCPDCDNRMDCEAWQKAAVTLVLQPCVFKSNSVSVVSECPKCFEQSWVHAGIDSFEWGDWPKDWIERVKALGLAKKLEAARDWGESICWKCRKLTEAKIGFHAWRYCAKGSGPAETKCDIFEPERP